MKRLAVLLLAGLALLATVWPARGEVFMLANGGRVEGQWLNRDEKPRQNYVIKLASGAQVTLDPSQVKQVVAGRAEQQEYDKVRPQYPDTAEGQWQLAEWCREHELPTQRKTHLQRVIELDTNHVEARRALGFTQNDGKWMTQEDAMIKQGYRLYKGSWKLPQQIELLENKRKQELAEKDWFQKIKRWRSWIGTDKEHQARENFAGIDDPVAVKALAAGLKTDSAHDMRAIYIEVLGRIGNGEAAKRLAECAIDDPVQETRLSCLDELQKKKNPEVVTYFMKCLRDRDNAIINRAAVALSRMKDPAAIPALVDSLITVHKQKIGGGNPGQMSMSFPTGGTRGGAGMSAGGGPKIVSFSVPNQPVLDALVTITGQNYGFDGQRWRAWYASQKKTETLDARRN